MQFSLSLMQFTVAILNKKALDIFLQIMDCAELQWEGNRFPVDCKNKP